MKKLKGLFLVSADSRIDENGIEEFHYTDADIYTKPDFENFLKFSIHVVYLTFFNACLLYQKTISKHALFTILINLKSYLCQTTGEMDCSAS